MREKCVLPSIWGLGRGGGAGIYEPLRVVVLVEINGVEFVRCDDDRE